MHIGKIKFNKKYLLCTAPRDTAKKSSTFCMAPWIHIHILPDASVIPCCVSPFDHVFGDAHKKELIEIWNEEPYRKLRRNMLRGIKSRSCHQCYEQEKSHIPSFRYYFNKKYAGDFDIVKTTSDDGCVEEMRIRYFDVRFSNVCNFKCRDCGATLSSVWFYENQKLYDYSSFGPRIVNCTGNGTNRLWQQLKAFVPGVHTFNFAGGEPLLMIEHYKILKLLIHMKLSQAAGFLCMIKARSTINDIVLTYVTNFSVIKFKDYNIFSLWKKFKKIYLFVSVDDVGKRGEYFRKGMSWPKLLQNLTLLKENTPHVHLTILTTVNIHNVYYFPEIYSFFVRNNYIKENQLQCKMLITPSMLSIQVLPKEFKEKVEYKLLYSVQMLKESMPGKNFKYYRRMIEDIIVFLNKEDHSHLLSEFQKRTQILDELRGENFIKIYPELAFLMDKKISFKNENKKISQKSG
jgi:sulfatase maturation enzyme AslB (radical SAM superfamily)